MKLAMKSAAVGLWSVDPGVGVQAVVLPQLTAISRVAVDHRQAVGQESSGCWVFWPDVIHLTCRTEEEEGHQSLAAGLYHTYMTSTQNDKSTYSHIRLGPLKLWKNNGPIRVKWAG